MPSKQGVLFTLLSLVLVPISYICEKNKSRQFELHFTKTHVPFLNTTLDATPIHAVIDLGGAFCCEAEEELIRNITKKTFSKKVSHLNYQGKTLNSDEYTIRKCKFLNTTVRNFLITTIPDNNKELTTIEVEDPYFPWNEAADDPSSQIYSAIGHKLLHAINFVLDFKKNKFSSFNKGITPLFQFPYGMPSLVNKIPFEYDPSNGLVCIINTSFGPKRFLIDTGFTLSLIKPLPNLIEHTQQISHQHLPTITFNSFILGKKNFGPLTLTVKEDLNLDYVDGILGMDFFHQKILYFDMEKHFLCIRE